MWITRRHVVTLQRFFFFSQVWLLEVNINPALHTNCQVLMDLLPGVVDETLSKYASQRGYFSNSFRQANFNHLVLVFREESTSCFMAYAADETKPFCSSPSAKRNFGNLLGPLWALNKDINAASHRLLTGLRLPLQCRPLFYQFK